jgi:hypothetical protein
MRSREVYCILEHLLSVHCRHAKTSTGMILACWRTRSMASTWRLRKQRAMKTSILVNCPCGSARTCRMAPFHFRPPIASLVLSPHICNPLQSHVGPQQQDQSACSQESCHPGGPPWGQHVPCMRPPSTFGRILQPGSSSLHVHMTDLKLLL